MAKRGVPNDVVLAGSKEERKIENKSLSISIKEGTAANVSSSITSTTITPFALELKATTTHISWLNAITGLLAPLAQFYGDHLMEKYSRKTIAKRFIIVQAIMLIPLIILGILCWTKAVNSSLVAILIAAYVLYAMAGGIVYPAWFSWMGDLIPEKQRGKYFGKRYRITETWGVMVGLISGVFLDTFKPEGVSVLGHTIHFSYGIITGFIFLFILAFIARLISYFYIKQQYEPKYEQKKEDYFSIWAFLKRMDNFGKFATGYAIFNFALMISSPFFAVYMLEDLKLNNNFTLFMIISLSSTVFYILFTKWVGKFSDKYGNKRLFALSCFLFSANPLIWLFIKNPYWLIPLQIVAGFANAAMTISVNNFTYDSVSQKHRALCITYTNILVGVGTFLGALVGGLIIKFAQNNLKFMNAFLFLFLISAILRWSVSLFIVQYIKEERKVRTLPIPHLHLHLHHQAHPRALHSELHLLKHPHPAITASASGKTSPKINLQKV